MTHSIYGEKGGKGGGGSSRVAKEAPNTLQSNSVARILDAIGEGEIVGLVDGHKSIIIDETPLQNEDGSYNFDGVVVTTRTGVPDQDFIPGFPSVETIRDISTQVYQSTPVVRTISTLTANAARVTISLPRLTEQNKKNGDLNGSRVTIAFDVMPAGGSWSEVIYNTISGKTTSTYQRSYRFELPGTGPWDIRMRRISDDESDDEAIQNDTYWATLTELTDAKLSYPDTALVALEVNAKDFGDTIPSRSYDVKGKIINVPDNYDPETRAYSGLWSGNFKLAWSDNPAWVYYDLATNERYGAAIDNVDKWSLYQIAQYCDELVDNGYGEQEPRYTFNSVLSSEEEAFDALNSLASVFRGMTFWGSDTVVATADMPADPMKLVTPSNVIDGEFEYQGTSLKDRHSIVLVAWNDPDSNYEKTIEVVEDSAAIQKYGFRKADLTAVGCTSRGQARRLGLWTLYSERSETETVTYRASTDQADLRPGEIIQVSDPSIAGARLGGRVRTPGLSTLTLDSRPEEASGSDWYLDVVMPNGGIERREVVDFNDNDVTLSSPLNSEPVVGAQWILSSSDVEPRTFRVIGIAEEDEGIYSITAVEHNPNKYAEIEQGLVLPEPDYSLLPSGPVSAPYNISTDTSTYIAGGTQHQKLTISWTGSDDPRVTSYICEVDGPDDVAWVGAYSGEGLSVDLNDISPGEWQIRVRGVTSLGQTSPWVIITTTIVGLLEPVAPDAVGIEVGTFQVKLSPTGGKPGQLWQYWRSSVALVDESMIETNAVLLASSNGFYTDTGLDPLTTYYYYIRGANNYGVSGWYPVQATTEGDASAILAALTDKITEGQLYQELNDRIDLIDGDGAGSVNERLSEEAGRVDSEIDGIRSDLSDTQSDLQDEADRLENRIDSVSAQAESARLELEAADAELDLRLDATGEAIVSEQEERELEDGFLAEEIKGLTADGEAGRARISSLERSKVEGDSIEAIQFAAIEASSSVGEASIRTQQTARVEGDEALASITTSLSARIDNNAASITTEEQARADGDSANASRISELSAKLDATPQFNSGFESGSDFNQWQVAGTDTLAAETGDVQVGSQSALITSTQSSASLSGAPNVTYVQLTSGLTDTFRGLEVVASLFVKQPSSGASSQMAIGYSAGSDGNSGWEYYTPTTSWTQVSLAYVVPDGSNTNDYFAIWADTSGGGDGVLIDSANVRLEYAVPADVTAAIEAEQQARADADAALASDITGLQASFGDVSADLITEQQARASADSALASDITILQAETTSNSSAILAEEQARADGDSALASRASSLESRMGDAESSIISEEIARATADEALSSRTDALEAVIGDSESLIVDESIARAAEDEALSQRITQVGARVGDSEVKINSLTRSKVEQEYIEGIQFSSIEASSAVASAAVRTEETARVDDVEAVATRTTGLEARMGDAEADIVTEQQARSDADGALATQINTVQSQLGDDIAAVQQSLTTDINAVNGTASALYTLRTDVNGRVSGFGLSNDGVESEFGILADRFYIADPDDGANEDIPFIFDSGTLYLREALIGSLTFNKLKDDTGTFIVQNGKIQAEYIQADQLVVDWAQINNVEVGTAHIKDAAIIQGKIADLAVTNAKIRNAAVDTLQIAGNAVTIPVGAYTGGSSDVPVGWSTAQTITINSDGAPCIIIAGFLSTIEYTADQASRTYATRARITRDGATIMDFGEVASVSIDEGATPRVVYEQSYADLSFLDSSTATGSRTYRLQVSRPNEFSVDQESHYVSRRHLSAVGAKR